MKYVTKANAIVWGTVFSFWPYRSGKRDTLRKGQIIESNDGKNGYAYIEKPVRGYVEMAALERIDSVPEPPPQSSEDIFIVPAQGLYYQMLHDYEYLDNHKPRAFRKAMPETVPLLDKTQFIPLNRAWQEFWFGLLVKSADGTMTDQELLEAWASLTANHRAFTDKHSANEDGYRDYILDLNRGSKKDMAIKTLSCGGNIIRVTQTGPRVYFKTLDIRENPPKISEVWGDWTVIHWATECVRFPEKGYPDHSYMVGRFPQLIGKGVPFPIISATGVNSVFRNRVKPALNWSTWSPYNPPFA